MTPKLKKIIIGLLVVAVLFILYVVFLKEDPQAETLVEGRGAANTQTASADAKLISSQITQALLKLQQIELDPSIFQNRIFSSLEDRSTKIENEPVGRTNPFAPLGDTSVNVANRTTSLDMGTSTAPSAATSTPN